MSITDFKRKVVYAPLADGKGQRLRVAGMADIAGWSREPDPVRLRQLLAEARAASAAPTTSNGRALVRASPGDAAGSPILGATPISNLYVNVQTLALASAGSSRT